MKNYLLNPLVMRLMRLCLSTIAIGVFCSSANADVGGYIYGSVLDYSENANIRHMKFKILSESSGEYTVCVRKNANDGEDLPDIIGCLEIPASITYSGHDYLVTQIDKEGFDDLSGITNVVIPEGVVSTEYFPFCDCPNLISIDIPASLVFSGDISYMQSFANNCPKLTAININPANTTISSYDGAVYSADGKTLFFVPEGKQEIEFAPTINSFVENTFYNGGLISVTIPESVTIIPRSCFAGCSSLNTITFHPKVVTIDLNAFANCSSLSNISLPDGLINLGERAFEGCTSLTSVTIPDNVVRVKAEVGDPMSSPFSNCTSLTEIKFNSTSKMQTIPPFFYAGTGVKNVVIPEGIVKIGEGAFGENVENVTLSSTVSALSLRADSFYGMGRGLKSIFVDDANPYFTSIDGVLLNADASTLVLYPPLKEDSEYELPASVTQIGECAFRNAGNISLVTLHNNVAKIAQAAFKESSITTITLPSTITEIEAETFSGCPNLSHIYMGDVTKIGNYAFSNCSLLTNIDYISGISVFSVASSYNFPPTLKEIGSYAFYSNTSVASVVMPTELETIKAYAFSECTNLANISLNGSIPQIGMSAFENTAWLSSQSEGAIYLDNYLIAYFGNPSSTVEVADGTLGIADYPFTYSQAKYIYNITLPESLKVIGESAFSNTKITSITIPDNVTYIGSNAFQCSTLESVVLGKKLEDTGIYLFSYSSPITMATIDCSACENLTVDGNYVYNHNTGKLLFGIYENADGEVAFADNVNYVNPQCLMTRNNDAGKVVTSLRFNKNMQLLEFEGYATFNDLFPSLQNFVVDAENPYFSDVNGVLYDKQQTILFAYPRGKTDINVTMPETVTRINNWAFAYNTTIQNVSLAKGVLTLGESCFLGCEALKSIDLGRSLVKIEDYALYDCYNLISLTLPPTFTFLGEMEGKSFLGNIEFLTFTTVGDISINGSDYAYGVTINYPCVSGLTLSNAEGITTNPYPGYYEDGEFIASETYSEGSESLYFSTDPSESASENYVVVTNTVDTGGFTEEIGGKKSLLINQRAYLRGETSELVSAYCENLVIKDGLKFSTPISFTATNVTAKYAISSERRTICLPIDCEIPEGAILEELAPENEASIGSTILTFNIVDTSIEAGRAYLIHTETTPITEFSASMVEVSPSVNIRQSAQLQPNFDEDITFDSSWRSKENNVDYNFFLYDAVNNKFTICSDTDVCPTSQCYLKVDDTIIATEIPVSYLLTPSSVDTISSENISKEFEIFDLQGRKIIEKPAPGVYIVNKTKIIINR